MVEYQGYEGILPLYITEYEVANNINYYPVFNWWVKDELWTQDRNISSMERRGVYAVAMGQVGSNNKYWRTTHKFGIEVLKTVENAPEIDCLKGTEFWEKYIRKKMKNVRIAFKNLNGVTPDHMKTGKIKRGYKYLSTHMMFILKWT